MPNVNILTVDDTNINSKQSHKRKTPTKVSNKSAMGNERKIAKSELISDENDNVEQFQTFELERSSTPNPFNLCEHCTHSHAKECCMYIYDDHSDIMKYSSFKNNVEEPYFIVDNDENFSMKIGRTTPKNFPTFTENDSSVADMKMHSQVKQPPILYLQHYFWPVYVPPYLHFYNPTNFVYYPHVNIPNHHMPPTSYFPTNVKNIPIPSAINTNLNNNNRHYYNQQIVGYSHHVPMNYNYM